LVGAHVDAPAGALTPGMAFNSVLIANRGEIAVRVIRACKELRLRTIAVFSEADRDAMHVRLADEARFIGPAGVSQSYLNGAAILAAAAQSGAEAVHPGYGMLSEDAAFARDVMAAGLTYIGPPAEAIATMGDKLAARARAMACGLPVLPGAREVNASVAEAQNHAAEISFPIAVKACFGGGGRGMRVARDAGELEQALAAASREAAAAFGRGEVYLEHYLERPRHVEVQIIADAYGEIVHLGDRDCSVQRRHQKLIEEAPAPELPDTLRSEMRAAAITLSRSVGYQSAGTVEFLVNSARDAFYFLEMNTRLQVEHGVTELVTGRDLVHLQLHIAAGRKLGFTQKQVRIAGHAIQARIAAEDPWAGFAPRPGRLGALRLPGGPGIRCDFGVEAGGSVPAEYDSMFGKVLAWADTRDAACMRLQQALRDFSAEGVATTAPYLADILSQPAFHAVTHHTASLEQDWAPAEQARANSSVSASTPTRDGAAMRRVSIATDRGVLDIAIAIRVTAAGVGAASTPSAARSARADGPVSESADPVAPMDGSVVAVAVAAGDLVTAGDLIATLEAMKMEMPIYAPRAGRVQQVLIMAGTTVTAGERLCVLSPAT